jgi:hypothetical protein
MICPHFPHGNPNPKRQLIGASAPLRGVRIARCIKLVGYGQTATFQTSGLSLPARHCFKVRAATSPMDCGSFVSCSNTGSDRSGASKIAKTDAPSRTAGLCDCSNAKNSSRAFPPRCFNSPQIATPSSKALLASLAVRSSAWIVAVSSNLRMSSSSVALRIAAFLMG